MQICTHTAWTGPQADPPPRSPNAGHLVVVRGPECPSAPVCRTALYMLGMSCFWAVSRPVVQEE